MKKCPQCGYQVDDLAIFCDNCDAVLDAKALIEDEEPKRGSPPSSYSKSSTKTSNFNRYKSVKSQQISSYQEMPKRSETVPPFVPKSSSSEKQNDETAAVQLQETFDEMISAYKTMGSSQKIGLLSSLFAFIFSFFPWVSVPQEGSVPGLDVGGFYLIFISIMYFTYIVLDFIDNQLISRFEQYKVLILVSIGFLGVLVCTYRIIFPYDIEESTTILKDIGLKLDIHRKFGLFLSTLSSIGMFISPLLGGFVKKE